MKKWNMKTLYFSVLHLFLNTPTTPRFSFISCDFFVPYLQLDEFVSKEMKRIFVSPIPFALFRQSRSSLHPHSHKFISFLFHFYSLITHSTLPSILLWIIPLDTYKERLYSYISTLVYQVVLGLISILLERRNRTSSSWFLCRMCVYIEAQHPYSKLCSWTSAKIYRASINSYFICYFSDHGFIYLYLSRSLRIFLPKSFL
jgi:hypothetical protein